MFFLAFPIGEGGNEVDGRGKKSAGFAFPGDVSFTLNMTRPSLRRSNATVAIPKIGVWAKIYRHSEAKPKPPRQVAPLRHATRATSPASTGEHTPGRVVFHGVDTQNKEPKCKKKSCISAL